MSELIISLRHAYRRESLDDFVSAVRASPAVIVGDSNRARLFLEYDGTVDELRERIDFPSDRYILETRKLFYLPRIPTFSPKKR